MRHRLLLLYAWFVRLCFSWLPDAPIFMRIRGACYGAVMGGAGKNLQISASVIIKGLERLYVGNDVYMAPGVIINAISEIRIEDEVMFGFNTVVVSGNHVRLNDSYRFMASNGSSITVGRGSWVGANCSILAGSVIGSGCVVAANSSCRGTLERNSLYGGVPAKKIKSIISGSREQSV